MFTIVDRIPPDVDVLEFISRAVRERRKALGFTLRQLAARSGVSASMLSAIESGQRSPTVSVLAAIAAALDVPVSQLIERHDRRAGTILTRASELREVKDRSEVVREHLGAVIDGARTEFVRYTIPPKVKTGDFAPHRPGSIERMFVQRGRLSVHIGKRIYHLRTGDSIVYRADLPHRFNNPGAAPAVIFLVIEQGG